jgi:hypothetical protein
MFLSFSIRANVIKISANPPFVIHIFSPVISKKSFPSLSFTGTAFVFPELASDPAPASVKQ